MSEAAGVVGVSMANECSSTMREPVEPDGVYGERNIGGGDD